MAVTGADLSDFGTVSIIGEFSLPRAREIQLTLLRALESHDRISLDLGNVSAADVSCLQLLCSLHKSLERRGKTLALSGKLPSLFIDLFSRAGYTGHVRCAGRAEGSCLLMEVLHD